MVWISQVINQDVNIFNGPHLVATSERDLFAQGFWAIALHRFGNWRMDVKPRILRLPFMGVGHRDRELLQELGDDDVRGTRLYCHRSAQLSSSSLRLSSAFSTMILLRSAFSLVTRSIITRSISVEPTLVPGPTIGRDAKPVMPMASAHPCVSMCRSGRRRSWRSAGR